MKNKRKVWAAMLVAGLMVAEAGAQSPFKGVFYNKEENISLRIDLYDESVTIPTMEFLGKTNGYMDGNVYGVWMVTSARIDKEGTAEMKLANDFGSETQVVELKQENDSTLLYKAKGQAVIKRAVKRKLVKIPTEMRFVRKR